MFVASKKYNKEKMERLTRKANLIQIDRYSQVRSYTQRYIRCSTPCGEGNCQQQFLGWESYLFDKDGNKKMAVI